jgi:hypothetical protein
MTVKDFVESIVKLAPGPISHVIRIEITTILITDAIVPLS